MPLRLGGECRGCSCGSSSWCFAGTILDTLAVLIRSVIVGWSVGWLVVPGLELCANNWQKTRIPQKTTRSGIFRLFRRNTAGGTNFARSPHKLRHRWGRVRIRCSHWAKHGSSDGQLASATGRYLLQRARHEKDICHERLTAPEFLPSEQGCRTPKIWVRTRTPKILYKGAAPFFNVQKMPHH